jgi:cytochrome b
VKPINVEEKPMNKESILIWDLPTRIFHWTLAGSFLLAYLSGESERWVLVHVVAGYTLAGLILFRLVWGFAGTRYARFKSFCPTLASVKRHVHGLLRGRAEGEMGHNPIGALAIHALLLLGLVTAISGWLTFEDIGGDWLEEIHEAAASLMLFIVVLHIAGVMMTSWLSRQHLVHAMVSGRKMGYPRQAINSSQPLVAVILLACLMGFWIWSFSQPENLMAATTLMQTGANPGDDDD